MTGPEFVAALEKEGFVVRRRVEHFVWMSRGELTLMLDDRARLPEGFLDHLLGRRSRRPRARLRRGPSALGTLNRLPRCAAKA